MTSDWFSGAVLRIVGTAILTSAAKALAGDGASAAAVRIVCGAAMLFALITPISEVDMRGYSVIMAQYRQEAAALTQQGQDTAERMLKTVIQDECGAYITTRALELGIEQLQVHVQVSWSGQVWYPVGCAVTAHCTVQQQRQLSDYITAEFGIQESDQQWNISY